MVKVKAIFEEQGVSDFWDTASKALITASTLFGNSKTQRTIVAGTSVVTVMKASHDWYKSRKSDDSFVIRIFETDPLYDHVQTWLTSSIDENDLRTVTLQTRNSRRGDNPWDSSSPDAANTNEAGVRIFYDGSRSQTVTIDGHRVYIRMDNTASGSDNSGTESARSRALGFIMLDCPTVEAKNAVIARLDKEAKQIKDRSPSVFCAMQWGSFRKVSKVPKRPISSVVLKEGQGERILGDVKDFLTREERYDELGMPFRRGILLEGAPGTGKSSVATALAHELRMDVYCINISSVQDDNTLIELVTSIGPGSILLLEDIDVASSMRERDDDNPGVTMSGILNALDGIATPHGIVTILTTNNAAIIDPAILRPGRVDLREEVSYIDNYQLRELCRVFLGYVPEDLPSVREDDRIVSAEVVECFKRNLDDANAAAADLICTIELAKTKETNAQI